MLDGVAVIGVDLGSGNRTIISDADTGGGLPLRFPRSIYLDAGKGPLRNNLAVSPPIHPGWRRRSSVEYREYSLFSLLASPASRRRSWPTYFCASPNGRALITDGHGVVAVDSTSGMRTLVSGRDDNDVGVGGGVAMDYAVGLIIADGGDIATVIDPIRHALIAVDMHTGERAVISR